MAAKTTRRDSFDWLDHRLSMVLAFIVFIAIVVHIVGWLFLPAGPRIETYTDEKGRKVEAWYEDDGDRPYEERVYDSDGGLVVDRYDRNGNGSFESVFVYGADGSLLEHKGSTFDNGRYDLKEISTGDQTVSLYDRDGDGRFEERHVRRNGLRVEDSIDRNGDGNCEQRVYYDSAGELTRMELDLDSDGKVDLVYPRGAARSGSVRGRVSGGASVRRFSGGT